MTRKLLRSIEADALRVTAVCRDRGWVKSKAAMSEAGQLFFAQLALASGDSKAWVLVHRLELEAAAQDLDRRRLALLESRFARTVSVVESPRLSTEEKEARIRQIMGLEP
jgi:hypothetical protein